MWILSVRGVGQLAIASRPVEFGGTSWQNLYLDSTTIHSVEDPRRAALTWAKPDSLSAIDSRAQRSRPGLVLGRALCPLCAFVSGTCSHSRTVRFHSVQPGRYYAGVTKAIFTSRQATWPKQIILCSVKRRAPGGVAGQAKECPSHSTGRPIHPSTWEGRRQFGCLPFQFHVQTPA